MDLKDDNVQPIALTFYTFDDNNQAAPIRFTGNEVQPGPGKKWGEAIKLLLRATTWPKNISPYKASPEPLPLSEKQVIVLFASTWQLSQKTTFDNLLHPKGLRPVNFNHKNQKGQPVFTYHPIIMVGYEDFLKVYAESDGDEEGRNIRIYHHNLDQRVKFFDSSIWHRYIPLYPSFVHYDAGEDMAGRGLPASPRFSERFSALLKDISRWYKDELYQSLAARATLEFQLRMMANSFITRMGDRGHYEAVTPFKFHSETQMQERSEALIEGFFKKGAGKKPLIDCLCWKTLLIDDYAEKKISGIEGNISASKKTIIESLLKGFNLNIDIDSWQAQEKEPGEDIVEKSLKKLEERYDLIFLDYLLGKSSGSKLPLSGLPVLEGRREYGHDFLQKLALDAQHGNSPYKRGPFMRYWIFPISSFPFALYDKMRQLGIDNYHELWHLSGGGDPITTPQLFRYNLLHFLKQQVLEAYLDDTTLANHLQVFSNIAQPDNWSQVVEARLKYILAQIQILDSYRIKHKKRSQKGSHFSEKLHQFIHYQSKYAKAIKELLRLVELFNDVLIDPGSDIVYLSKILESPEKTLGIDHNSPLSFYPKALSTLWVKMKEFLCTTPEVESLILKNTREHELDLSLPNDKKILIVPGVISKVKQLVELNLNDNLIQGLPEELEQLKELRKIELKNNKLKVFPQVLFKLSEQLEYLDLSGNQLPLGLNKRANDERKVKELFNQAKILETRFIDEARAHIKKADLEGTFEKLHFLFERAPQIKNKFSDTIANLEYQYNDVLRKKSEGLLTAQQYQVTKNRIVKALLENLNIIEEKIQQIT